MQKQLVEAQARLGAVGFLKDLPRDLPSILEVIGALHSDRLVFTDEAIASARAASCCDKPQELADAWRALWEMATTLHELFFSGDAYDIEKAFRGRTGIELTMVETGTTQKDAKLMRLRRRIYQGREIWVTPHVKLGSRPRWTRIHFAVDQDAQRIIVGHCGDHLDTAGTRQMS